MNVIKGCICCSLLILCGCAQRITLAEYNKKCTETYNPNNSATGHVYYCGSKNGFDYVCFSPFLATDDMTKIDSGILHVIEMQYTSDEAKWVVIYPSYQNMKLIKTENYGILPHQLKFVPDKAPEKQVPYR